VLLLNSIFIYSCNLALVEIIYITLVFNRTNNFPSFLYLEQACAKKEYALKHFNCHKIFYAGGGVRNTKLSNKYIEDFAVLF
jgi:hypothetical protein